MDRILRGHIRAEIKIGRYHLYNAPVSEVSALIFRLKLKQWARLCQDCERNSSSCTALVDIISGNLRSHSITQYIEAHTCAPVYERIIKPVALFGLGEPGPTRSSSSAAAADLLPATSRAIHANNRTVLDQTGEQKSAIIRI